MRLVARLVPAGLLGLLTSGCMTGATWEAAYQAQTPPTASERAQIVAKARDSFVDPHSIQDAEISNVVTADGGRIMCVYANAKNRMGGYAGKSFTRVEFNGRDNLMSMDELNTDFLCSKERMRYQPFPELENHAGA